MFAALLCISARGDARVEGLGVAGGGGDWPGLLAAGRAMWTLVDACSGIPQIVDLHEATAVRNMSTSE